MALAQLKGVAGAPSFSRRSRPLESGVKVTVPWALTVAVAPEETSRTAVLPGTPSRRSGSAAGPGSRFPRHCCCCFRCSSHSRPADQGEEEERVAVSRGHRGSDHRVLQARPAASDCGRSKTAVVSRPKRGTCPGWSRPVGPVSEQRICGERRGHGEGVPAAVPGMVTSCAVMPALTMTTMPLRAGPGRSRRMPRR